MNSAISLIVKNKYDKNQEMCHTRSSLVSKYMLLVLLVMQV